VPDDLLRNVSGPQAYASWWLWLAVALLAVVCACYAALFVWTLPAHRLRRMRGVRAVHARIVRRRFAGSVAHSTARHRAGTLSAADACAEISRTLRSFLHQVTGTPAQYMATGDIAAAAELAAAAPVLETLADARFRPGAQVDVDAAGRRAEELIRSWP
jgi:hypothetical protein